MSRNSPAARIANAWRTLGPLPGGKWMFSKLLGIMVPYSGSIRPRVLELSPGHAVVAIRERRALRQHLGSIHALALGNLGELASGLAMTMGLPADVRGIVTGMEIEFHKKARGRIVATSDVVIPRVTGPVEHRVEAHLADASGERVATVRVLWRLAPLEPRAVPPAAPADATRVAGAAR